MPSTNDRILTYLTESVRILLRETIDEYAGAEVFFVGRVGETGRVEEAEPFAFGNQEAVPVIEQVVCPGNVVIHNHPGGHLEPSQADIEVASRFGNVGVGSFIIDNEAQNIRIIVPIMKIAECQGLDIAKLEELLSDCGPLARAMNRYERRLEQSRMLRTVAESFNRDGIAVIEAGTGVGKSLAYLIPAIFWAKKNQEKVIISTNTINLQEQLIQKDIPFLQKHLGLEFRAELMKGRGNYLCLRRAAFVRHTPDFFADEQQGAQLFDILEWAAKTPEGSLSSIGFIPDFDIWEQVSCDPDNCTKIRCQFYAKCFFYQARRRAAAADLIVANHHLVMADLAVRQETGNYTSTAVLPAYKRIIFDEAHNIEDVATQYFGIAITRRVMARLLSRLIHREKSRMGLLPFLRDRLVLETYRAPSQNLQDAVQLIEERLVPLRQEIATGVRDLMDTCARGAAEVLRQEPQPGHEIQLRITPNIEDTEFWSQNLRRAVRQTTTAMDEMASGLMKVRNALVKLPEKTRQEYDNPIGELKSISGKLSSRADEFRHFHT
ncbi:DEAD/DEAH box helicase, partial [bacterium]|nr:DEAD/DEAH box helicase [bacterium]